MGFATKELEQTQYSVNVVKGGATRDVNIVGEDSLEKVDSFRNLSDVLSCVEEG